MPEAAVTAGVAKQPARSGLRDRHPSAAACHRPLHCWRAAGICAPGRSSEPLAEWCESCVATRRAIRNRTFSESSEAARAAILALQPVVVEEDGRHTTHNCDNKRARARLWCCTAGNKTPGRTRNPLDALELIEEAA
eukprot:3556608-Prymnesium_polylepis.1